ncbi:MAG: preprotein translocase subunit SecG [Planctomycetota bacterium]|jgi:protein translocase SecG subunit
MQYLMYVAYVVYVAAAVLMIGAILLQEGKGGGLSALGGTQAESAFGASNPIRRMTVVLAILFFLLAGFLSVMSSRGSVSPGVERPEAVEGPAGEPGEGPGEEPGEPGGADEAGAAAAPGEALTSEETPAASEGDARAPAGGDEAKTGTSAGDDAPAAPGNE